MDDHMYNLMMNYAQCELIPRFQSEYEECKAMNKCPSYEEIKDLCVALNAVASWAGYNKVTPSDLLDML